MFVRWECGCVGIPAQSGLSVIIRPCDQDRDAPAESLTWGRRDMTDKASAPLVEHSEKMLHTHLATRLVRADRFDTIRTALEIQG